MSNSNVSPTSNLDEDEQLHHPRIHARNLSIFFPHPDQQQGLKTSALVDNHQEEEQVLEIPSAKLVGWDIHSLHSPPPSSSSSHPPPPPPTSLSSSSSRTRRGHHHRHSLSHNFFPFLSEKPVSACSDHQTSQKDREDDSPASKHQQNRAGGDHKKAIISPTWSFPKTPVTPNSALPKPVPTEPHNTSPLQSLPRSSTSLIRRTHRSMALQLIYTLLTLPSKLLQLRILVALLALALGAILWLRGQQTDCLSLAGLGYLLVFDALGAFHAVFFNPRPDDSIDRIWEALGRRDSASSIRLPFGRARLATLSVFTQALFLLFSAIYVCKEAVEHMMMSHPHGPDNAGGGGGSHVGHSERHQSEMEVSCTLVGSALALVLFNALVSNNHRPMALIAIGGKQAGLPEPVLNPFSTISLGFGLLVMGAGCFVSPSQSGKADGLIALLIVFVIIKLVWPVLVDTASVLLQTAPSEKSVLNKVTSDLTRRLSDLQKDPQSAKILQPHLEAIERPKLWRLTADPSGLIVCTLPVRVRQDTPPSDVLRISEAVRTALHPLKLELTVHISVGNLGHLDALRASRLVTCAHGHGHGHSHSHSHSDDHHHSHDHSHSHGQGHSHSHDHDHGHFHSHGHDHGHLHHQDHPRPHSRKHSQSHSLTPAIPIHTSEAHLLLSPVDPDPFSPGSETHDSLLEHHHDHPSFDDSPDSHSSDSDDQSSPNIVHNDLMHHHHHLCH